jgi:amino acid adenylation domain-containing protein
MNKHCTGPTTEFSTLVELLRSRALYQPNHRAYTFLLDGETKEVNLTYAKLDQQARAIASLLQDLGATGERALLLYPPGLEYIAAFFGCLYAGAIAVPSYPPRLNRPDPRLRAIVADAQATIALTTPHILANTTRRFAHSPELEALRWVATGDLASSLAKGWHDPMVNGDTLAFLQYTSGSTAAPKGVAVNHRNILHNERMIQQAFGHTEQSVVVGWLPIYHDMGLIGNVFQPLYVGAPCVLMSPLDFLQEPYRWLQAISHYEAHTSGGPNFAYDLCVRKITPEQRATLDLHSWEVAFNGAEPIRRPTLERFAKAFEPCGFRRETFYPCYGLAEATLFVSGGLKSAPPISYTVQGAALEQDRVVVAAVEDKGGRTLVGCGQTWSDQKIVVVHPESLTRCPPEQVGEIWISGSNVAQGYWNRPEETNHTFRAHLADTGEGPFLRTGDLGFLKDGELFITGRIKDLIIIRGRNHYPQDIEQTTEQSHPALRPGCGAAFSIDVAGEEQLVLVYELKRTHRNADVDQVAQVIRQAVAEEHELQVYAIVLLKPMRIPKTSSGKIQRRACRAMFLTGKLEAVGESILDDATPLPEADTSPHDAPLSKDLPAMQRVLGKSNVMPFSGRRPTPVGRLEPETAQQGLDSYPERWTERLSEKALQPQRFVQQHIARVLKVTPPHLDPQRPLSALGLDSLMAVELKHSLETGLGVVLPVANLTSCSIAQLAAQIAAQLAAPEQGPQASPMLPVSRVQSFPLSFAQRRLWFLDQLEPGNPAYHIPVAVRLEGDLDVAALARSINDIIRRHEALRTVFSVVDGQPIQIIAPALSVELPVIDLRELPEAQRRAETQRLQTEQAIHPFDLTQGPLLRATLLMLPAKHTPRSYGTQHAIRNTRHLFLLTMHHIVSDGWSMTVFGRELSALYRAFSNGKPASLPELPIQYADFAHWQEHWLRGDALETQLSYWRKQLGGDLTTLNLPTDRPRPAIQTYRGARQSITLSKATTEALKALGRREGCTLFITLLTAFKIILQRHSGQDDVVVGAPIAGRDRAETRDLIGFFLNTLVLRTDLSGNPTFLELLKRVREVAWEAYANQDVPFEKLLDELRPQRDLSHTPLFQVFFNMLNLPNKELELPGLKAQVTLPLESVSLFDLTLYVKEQDEKIKLDLVYNTDLFEQIRMAEMLEQLYHLLQQIAAQPGERVARYSPVTATATSVLPDPTQALGSDWEGAVHTQISRQARRVPQHPAVLDERGTWTYQELDARSNQLAHYLRAHGIGAQDVVAIYGHRSVSLVWALLGVLKAGAAFMILDPAYPALRLLDYVQLAKPHGWLQVEAAGRLSGPLEEFVARSPHLVCRLTLPPCATDAAHNLLKDYSTGDAGVTVGPDDLACVTFTSGSTGKPKGIMGRHGSLSHFMPWQRQTFGLGGSDRYSMLSGLSHDPLQRDIFTSLWLGATLCIPAPEELYTPGRLAGWMKEQKISVAHLTPAMIQLLTQAQAGEEIRSLRYAFIVGDALTRQDVSRLQKLAPWVTCVNFYGTTETQRAVGYYVVPPPPPQPDEDLSGERQKQVLPLGRGVEDVQLLILNTSRQLAGIGEVGEIYVRSPHLARGYIGDDALTQACFLINPFTAAADDRLYKTGDLGRYLPDGNVEFLGRADFQVKIRGFRVEPGEIEAALGGHPAVQQAVVLAREDGPGDSPTSPWDKRLVAYVVLNQRQTLTASELRRFLRGRLPVYMVPAAFVFLERLPLTPNRKVDRSKLPAPDKTRLALEQAFVAPQTPVEGTLAHIWAEVLGLERVGVHSNFFDLGGHSLHLIQVHSKLRQALDRELPVIKMFEYPTIRSLAAYLSQEQDHYPALQQSADRGAARIAARLEQRGLCE